MSEVRFCQSYNIRVIKVPMFQRHLSQDLCLLGASTSQPQCRRFLAFQRLMTLDRNPASLRSVLHLRCGLRLSKADGQGVPAGLGLHKGVALVDIYIYIHSQDLRRNRYPSWHVICVSSQAFCCDRFGDYLVSVTRGVKNAHATVLIHCLSLKMLEVCKTTMKVALEDRLHWVSGV